MNDIEKTLSSKETTEQLNAEVEQEMAALGDMTVEALMDKVEHQPLVDQSKPEGDSEDASQSDSAKGEIAKEDSDNALASSDEASAEVQTPATSSLKRGRITAIHDDDVFIELAGLDSRLQGIVPLIQFERPPRAGSIMDFAVDRIDEKEGIIHLSREGAITQATWSHLHKGSVVEARVTGANKGGLELEMVGSIRAFMPASQVDIRHIEDLESFVGEKLQALVHDIDRKARKIVISRRRFLEQQRARLAAKVWANLKVEQSITGTVSSLVDYGAFVDIGGVDGLLHISDMSYAHITKPSQVVKVGQEVTVQVLKIDLEKKRVRLGLKQAQPDPWDGIVAGLHVGSLVTGKVLRIASFGAFIEIQPGVEGLLPASEMSWKRHAQPEKIVKEGQALQVQVILVDLEKRRLTLSIKQIDGDPWMGCEQRFAKDSLVKGTVKTITEFGAFVEITSGVEGMVHISELANQRVDKVEDVIQVGQIHEFRVLESDEDNHKIRLSIRAVENQGQESNNQSSGRGNDRGGRGGRRDKHATSTLSLPKLKFGSGPLKGGIE